MQSYRKGRAQSVEVRGAAAGSVVPAAAQAGPARGPGEASGGGSGSRLQPERPAQGPEGTVCNPDF
jgi:hypothetical protein